MKQETKVNVNGGVGFLGLLTIVFITLKLLGIIKWSWWLVLLPAFIPTIVFLILGLSVITIYIIKLVYYSIKERKER